MQTPLQGRKSGGRQLYLDVARVLAIISISLNHAVNRTYNNYSNQMQEFLEISLGSTILKTVVTVFSQLGVPLFLMISGALLLNKRIENGQDVKRFYKHNLLSLFITTEIWYFLMYWCILLFNPGNHILETEGIGSAIIRLFSTMFFVNQTAFGSMWYMPMILCLYITIPFAVIVKDKVPGRYLCLPLLLVFLRMMLLQMVNSFCSFRDLPTLSSPIREANLCSMYYLYVFAGYWISRDKLSKMRNWMLLTVLGVVFAACCAYQLYAYKQPANYLVSYESPGILLCAAFLFEAIRRYSHLFERLKAGIAALSKMCFGIYFVHIIIMSLLVWYMSFTGWHRSLKLLFLEAVSVLGSILIIAPLSKIKVCRKYLFDMKN
ncbi:MAG: acyltransferase [Faecousia sp.]